MFITGRTRQGSGLTAIEDEIRLGSILTSYSVIFSVNLLSCHTLKAETSLVTADNTTLDQTLKMFWDLEAIGVKPDETSVCEEFIHFELCQMRLRGLIKRLRQSPHILQEYDGIIKEQINQGIVEAVDDP